MVVSLWVLPFRRNIYCRQLDCVQYKFHWLTFNCSQLNAGTPWPRIGGKADRPLEDKHGTETGGGLAAATGQSNLLCGLFDRARVQPCLQAAARSPRADLSAISGHAGAVGTRRRAAQGYRRTAVSGFRDANAAAEANGNRRPDQAYPPHRGRTPGADRTDAEGSGAEGKSPGGAGGDSGEFGLLARGAVEDQD